MKRSADESQISVLLKDFEDADLLLAKVGICFISTSIRSVCPELTWLSQIIDASKAWRDSWSSILSYQHRLVNEFEGMYAPIVGAADSYHGHQPVDTPENTMTRTVRLREEYEELKKDLMEEVNMVDEKMIKPAMDARDSLSLMKKTIKKREDRKVQLSQLIN